MRASKRENWGLWVFSFLFCLKIPKKSNVRLRNKIKEKTLRASMRVRVIVEERISQRERIMRASKRENWGLWVFSFLFCLKIPKKSNVRHRNKIKEKT